MNCSQCNGYSEALGQLGNLVHMRCNHCGWMEAIDADDYHENYSDAAFQEEADNIGFDDEDEDDGRFADGDALASAGFGTDEDYGCFNSGDEF